MEPSPSTEQILSGPRKLLPWLIVCATVCLVGGIFLWDPIQPKLIQWIPYSPDEVAARQLNGEPTAILYFANWTVGANHRGGLLSPSIAQSLAAFQLAVMSADLTDANSGDFQRLAETGIVEIPAFVLYPGGNDSEPVIFLSGTADEEIVAAIEHSAG